MHTHYTMHKHTHKHIREQPWLPPSPISSDHPRPRSLCSMLAAPSITSRTHKSMEHVCVLVFSLELKIEPALLVSSALSKHILIGSKRERLYQGPELCK